MKVLRVLSLSLLSACQPAAVPTASLPPGAAGIAAWKQARSELRALRQRFASRDAYTMNLTLSLGHAQVGRRIRARGAVAVAPPHAMRMILLGPGGTTAFDLWVCRDRFRLAIPALGLERRGDASSPPELMQGMPVSFLRWWFLEPLGGSLLAFDDGAQGRRYVLSDGGPILHVEPLVGDALRVRRRVVGDEERMQVDGADCGVVHYQQRSTGVDIEVECEQREQRSPPPAAFADPDDLSLGCDLEVQP